MIALPSIIVGKHFAEAWHKIRVKSLFELSKRRLSLNDSLQNENETERETSEEKLFAPIENAADFEKKFVVNFQETENISTAGHSVASTKKVNASRSDLDDDEGGGDNGNESSSDYETSHVRYETASQMNSLVETNDIIMDLLERLAHDSHQQHKMLKKLSKRLKAIEDSISVNKP